MSFHLGAVGLSIPAAVAPCVRSHTGAGICQSLADHESVNVRGIQVRRRGSAPSEFSEVTGDETWEVKPVLSGQSDHASTMAKLKSQQIVVDKTTQEPIPNFGVVLKPEFERIEALMRRRFATTYFGVDPIESPDAYLQLETQILSEWRGRAEDGDMVVKDELLERQIFYEKTDPSDHIPLLDYESRRMLPGYGRVDQ